MKTYFSPSKFNTTIQVHTGLARLLSLAVLGALFLGGTVHPAVGADQVVQIKDNFFSPKQLRIAPNDTVVWTNLGNNLHTTTSSTGLWDSGALNHGGSFSRTFTNQGSFPYFCQVHGVMMSGTINVTTNTVVSNLFLVIVSGTFTSTNALGKVVVTPEKTKNLVADCAADHQLNAADLTLVYDRQADSIKVVRIDDGSTVCTMISFAGGATVEAADGKRRDRQAFVFWEDSDDANGSIVGTELTTRGPTGELLKYSFRGLMQFGLESYEDEPPTVFQGTFNASKKFVPAF